MRCGRRVRRRHNWFTEIKVYNFCDTEVCTTKHKTNADMRDKREKNNHHIASHHPPTSLPARTFTPCLFKMGISDRDTPGTSLSGNTILRGTPSMSSS